MLSSFGGHRDEQIQLVMKEGGMGYKSAFKMGCRLCSSPVKIFVNVCVLWFAKSVQVL